MVCSIALAAGVVGMVALMNRVAWRHRLAHAGGYGACGGYRDRAWRRGPGGSFWLRALFARLDTTPGQEREIRAAVEEFQAAARNAREGIFGTRVEVARAVSGETFDASAIDAAASTVDVAASRVKEAFRAALERIHGVLDANQRARLGEILTRGPRGFRRRSGGAPYRGSAI